MARQPGVHHELVLIDQSQLRQRQREFHASHEQSLARLPLELLNGLPQIPAHELRVPIYPVQGARHDVLLCRVDGPGEGFHPIRPRSRTRRRPPRCLHHFVSHPAKKYVVSSTLDRVDWNAELVRGDLGKAVEQLKRESGTGLFVGGVKLALALTELGLIDEYEFVVHPRLAGHGPTLFAGLSKWVDLKLVSRLEFGSGAVAMRYEPRR